MQNEEPKVITVEAAGEILKISRASAYQAVALGEIPSIRIGRRLLVPRAKLMEMLGEGVTEPAPAVAIEA
ncbi:MAG: helix-turn-helix domain-containing protein [Chloroflexi bacterium]|nr:helix-turn-helix domain-containing protein [Chloroflexota bacterium]